MINALSAALLLAAAASAQTLEDAYVLAAGRVASPGRVCWSRGRSAAADAAGMPAAVCLDWLKIEGSTAKIAGFAVLAGGAQREPLRTEAPVSSAGSFSRATLFVWEAGEGEFDEESVFQIAFRVENGAVVPGSLKPVAFHQCPERGCSYACGVTSVEFK